MRHFELHSARPSRDNTVIRSRFCICSALTLLISVAPSLQAQPHATRTGDSHEGFEWARVSLTVRSGTFHSTGNSDAHRLLERALTSGRTAFEPLVTGASLHLPISSRWGVHAGVDGGHRTTSSESRVRPAGEIVPVQQRTQFALSSYVHAGLDVTAWKWSNRASLVLTAGVGRAAYRLRQHGAFMDLDRLVVFDNEFHSAGRGTVGYGGAALDVPLSHWASLQADVRRQGGSAGMSGDFAGFDRLDLGGTRISAGLALRPFAR